MLTPYTFWFPGMSNEPWSNFILVDRGLKYELAHFHLRQIGMKILLYICTYRALCEVLEAQIMKLSIAIGHWIGQI